MEADQICSSCQDTEQTFNREWTHFLVDDFIVTNFGEDVDLVPLNYFLERISGLHFLFSDYLNRKKWKN